MLTPRPRQRARGRGRSGGFGLIEVLIALVLLSVGLLGLAGLQTASLRNNDSALVRSRAVAMAYDILDRIRANRTAAAADAYDTKTGEAAASIDDSTVAGSDLKTWKEQVEKLPGGEGSVNLTSGTFTVAVQWNESWDKSSTGGTQTVTLSTQP